MNTNKGGYKMEIFAFYVAVFYAGFAILAGIADLLEKFMW